MHVQWTARGHWTNVGSDWVFPVDLFTAHCYWRAQALWTPAAQ